MTTIKALLANSNDLIDKTTRQQLLLEILNKPYSFLISHDDYILTADELEQYQRGIDELAQGRPFAYVVGHQPFWRHDFIVNEHTLIPRPDTERLVETIIDLYKNSLSKNINLLDLGTGSGCIAISLAYEFPNWQITAIDQSIKALKIAKQNAENIKVNNITFLQSDWFSIFKEMIQERQSNNKLTESPTQFDIIVSNPPYIDPTDSHLAALTHEPICALTAEQQGLADIITIIDESRQYLKARGLLAIEHGYDQGSRVAQVFHDYQYTNITGIKDYGGNDRVTYATYQK